MAESLLHRAFYRKIHIALFFIVALTLGNVNAQSLLLPGDMMFVSVNATDNSFEFVPLINLEEGTVFTISNSKWDNKDNLFSDGGSISFKVLKEVEAGNSVLVQKGNAEGFQTSGSFELSKKEEQLFLFQEDLDKNRFISAIGWGEKRRWRDRSFFGSDLPEIFEEYPNSVIKLGNQDNYQYYVRNGVSGTIRMLNQFISNTAYWRGSETQAYPQLGTSFNLLNAPVILFDDAVSTVEETKKKTILNVAIYEHDGSKLTADVVFDSVYSSLSREELDGFLSQRINFTGLIGDAVYEVEVPVLNDKNYEGDETAIFNLENLSKGKAGDFISHTLFIVDDELPELKMELVDVSGENVLMIHNLERNYVDLRNWEIQKGDESFVFSRGTGLEVGATLLLVSPDYSFAKTEQVITVDEDFEKEIGKKGTFRLINQRGEKVAEFSISDTQVDNSPLISETIQTENASGISSNNSALSTANSNNLEINNAITGWKTIPANELNNVELRNTELFYWSEPEGVFKSLENRTDDKSINVLAGYFDQSDAEKLLTSQKEKSPNQDDRIKFSISVTDQNEDGLINENEGFSLVQNNSGSSISSQKIINLLAESLELNQEPQLFKSNNDYSSIRRIEDNAQILPGTVFWIKIHQPLSAVNVNLSISELSGEYLPEDESELTSYIDFAVRGNSSEASFKLIFGSDEAEQILVEQPSTVMELYLNSFTGISLSSNISGNNYSQVSVNQDAENTIELPLTFASGKNEEFELFIKNWENIPNDWVILLIDEKEVQEVIIDENWSTKFNYFGNVQDQEEAQKFPFIEDRFKIKVIHESQLDEDDDELPNEVELYQNYPNPFNPATSIGFYMPEENEVKLSVFNIVGQPVAVLFEGTKASGEHIIEWEASDMPSGMYIYQLEVGTKIMTRKMTLVK